MPMTLKYVEAANRYRPEKVRVLLLAESPPAFTTEDKKAYFYFEENPGGDILFATVIKAVLSKTYRKRQGPSKTELLRELQAEGIWLIDAVEYPINKIGDKPRSDAKRRCLIDKESADLFKRLALVGKSAEMSIVLIKNLVYQCLAEPIRNLGYHVPQTMPIGFPRYYRDPKTIEGIQSALAKCRGA